MTDKPEQNINASSPELIILLPDEGWRAEANKIIRAKHVYKDSLDFNFREQLVNIRELKYVIGTIMFNSSNMSDPEFLILVICKEWLEIIAKFYEQEQKTRCEELKCEPEIYYNNLYGCETIKEYSNDVFTLLLEKNIQHPPKFVEDISFIKKIYKEVKND
jgi:hypothetical protein